MEMVRLGDSFPLQDRIMSKQVENYFEERNMTVQPASFSNGTDYVGFVDLGIPVGGLYTGTPPQDNSRVTIPIISIGGGLTLNTRVYMRSSTPYRVQEGPEPCRLSHTPWRAMQFILLGFRRGPVSLVGAPIVAENPTLMRCTCCVDIVMGDFI